MDDMLDGELPPYSSVCSKCRHLTDPIGKKCEAFPDGIPPEIWLGQNNHKKPFFDKDRGIQFEPKDQA